MNGSAGVGSEGEAEDPLEKTESGLGMPKKKPA